TLSCAPVAVRFTDLSTGTSPATSWLWNFGDGSTSTQRDPVHTYVSNGSYTVTLIVGDVNGCMDTLVKPSYIRLNPPVANFTAGTLAGCTGTAVQFSDISLSDTTLTGWLWNFGDGSTSTLQNPQYTYSAAGVYDVTLIITNATGCRDTLVRSNYINIYTAPTAAFTPSSPNGCSPLPISFSNTSVGNSGVIVSQLWNFGDGNTSTQATPSHTYLTPGTYTVTLTVTDANGCTGTTSQTIRVYALPNANFFTNSNQGCAGTAIQFVNTSTGPNGLATYKWYFGDGDSSSAAAPSHFYDMPGTYSVTLIVFDPNGCSDTLVRSNYIRLRHPVADFVSGSTDICPGDLVVFNDRSVSDTSIVAWDWTFGNGQTSTLQNPSVVYSQSGTYSVSLIVTNALGCRDTLLRSNLIEVATRPAAQFAVSDPEGCTPFSVSMTNTSAAATWPIVGYQWTFGNGLSSNLPNPAVTYTAAGSYQVMLIATDQNGCRDTAVQTVRSLTLPQSNFVSNDRVGCAPEAVDFLSTATGDYAITGYQWNFGDGNTSPLQFPTHVYQNDGTYTVSLTVTDINGCVDTEVKPQYVRLSHPVANFTFSQSSICPGTAISFQDASTPDTTLSNWTWNFGDGTSSTLQSPQHIYTVPGTYTVTLTVRNVLGCEDMEVKTALIQVQQAPTTQFTPSAVAGCSPLRVNFTNTTVINSAQVVSWLWNFGNGVTSTLVNPAYTFVTPGTYAVTLTATDAVGCATTYTQNIVVYPLPVAGFVASDSVGCAPAPITFFSQTGGVNVIAAWQWSFGDGGSANTPVPIHTYTNDGVYDVQLIVTDINGCRDTLAKPNYIRLNHPVANFLVDDDEICPGTQVQFSDNSEPDTTLVSWLWNFGDGSTSTQPNPVHIYSTPGTYTVTLRVTNVLGCSDEEIKTQFIEVLNLPTPAFSMSDTTGCPPMLVNFRDLSSGNPSPVASWSWDLGNGLTSAVRNPSAYYPNPGVYPVTLTITDFKGCVSTLTQNVTVINPPQAAFTASDTVGCEA
ncbi:MAG: PKD domain-containing protein, partial [Bacteroidetes bacterium]